MAARCGRVERILAPRAKTRRSRPATGGPERMIPTSQLGLSDIVALFASPELGKVRRVPGAAPLPARHSPRGREHCADGITDPNLAPARASHSTVNAARYGERGST